MSFTQTFIKVQSSLLLRDTEIQVGKPYLDLLTAMNMEAPIVHPDVYEDVQTINKQHVMEGAPAPEESEEPEAKVIDLSLLELEREKAEQLVAELKAMNWKTEVFVSDPESEDGGFWTSRFPQIGDYVKVPRAWLTRRESQEACETREDSSESRENNVPDTSPFAQLGWEEDPILYRITLWDIAEILCPNNPTTKPYTQYCLSLLNTYGKLTGAPAVKAWAERLGLSLEAFTALVAREHAAKRRDPNFASQFQDWTREWAFRNTYVWQNAMYNKIKNDRSLWWIEEVEDLQTNEDDGEIAPIYRIVDDIEYDLRKEQQYARAK